MKTSELQGAALDWAVSKCEGDTGNINEWLYVYTDGTGDEHYSTDWAQGGPIIDRTGICLSSDHEDAGDGWIAYMPERGSCIRGDTALIAAMRCYVASKLRDEVEIPEELTEGEPA